MASLSLQVGSVWASGTSVGAYPVSQFPTWAIQKGLPGTAPTVFGSATASNSVASDGSLSISGLADATAYLLADGSGVTYLRGVTPVRSVPAGTEIAYAQNTAGVGPSSNLITSPADVTSLQITIPAGTPDYMLEFNCPAAQVSTGASWVTGNGQPVLEVQLVDETPTVVGTGAQRPMTTAVSLSDIHPFVFKVRMSATATAKTIKAQSGLLSNNTNMSYVLFGGAGGGNGAFAPMYLQAYAR